MRAVGIRGGIRPEAAIGLQRRPPAMADARDAAGHVPLPIDVNTQVPSRIAHPTEGAGPDPDPDPAPALAAMARRPEAAGACAPAMPGNAAHRHAPAIRAATGVPLLDTVALSAEAEAVPPGPVGVLASPATRRTGLWEAALPDRCLWAEDEAATLAATRALERGEREAARAALAAVARELGRRGAASVLIACAEFSLLADALPAWPIPIDGLARAILDAAGARPRPGGVEVRARMEGVS